MLVRVVEPSNGKEWIYNGYFQLRVYKDRGEASITELPDYLLRWDGKEWVERKQSVPAWGEYVGPSPQGEWKQKVGMYPQDQVKPVKGQRPMAAETPKRVKVSKERASDMDV